MEVKASFRSFFIFGLLCLTSAIWRSGGGGMGIPGEPCGQAAPPPLNMGPFVSQVPRRGRGLPGGLSLMQAMVLEQLDMTELALLQLAFPGVLVPRTRNRYGSFRPPRLDPRPPPPPPPMGEQEGGFPQRFPPPPGPDRRGPPPHRRGPPPRRRGPPPPPPMGEQEGGVPQRFPPPPGPPPRPRRLPPPRQSSILARAPGRARVFPPPPGPAKDIFAPPSGRPAPRPGPRPPPQESIFAPIPAVSIRTVQFDPSRKPPPGHRRSPVTLFQQRPPPMGHRPRPPLSERPRPPFLPPPNRSERPNGPPPRGPPPRRPPPRRPPPRRPPMRGPPPRRPPPRMNPFFPRPHQPGGFNPYLAMLMELDIPDPLLPYVYQSAMAGNNRPCYCTSASACGESVGRPAPGFSHQCDGRFNLVCCCR